MTTVQGWDGSVMRTVDAPDGRSVEMWDAARVVAGEPVQWCVVGVGDVGRHAYRWKRVASRWAGAPFWGDGPPPVAAIGTGRDGVPQPPLGHGPDGTPVWSQAHRFVAVPGSRGDRHADGELLRWICDQVGPVDVALGHGEGARLTQTTDTRATTTVLLDGGLPIGPDRDDVELARSWVAEAPDAVLVPSSRPMRYELRDVDSFMTEHPATPWRQVGHDHLGMDHDRIVDSAYAAMIMPGLVWRVRNGRRL